MRTKIGRGRVEGYRGRSISPKIRAMTDHTKLLIDRTAWRNILGVIVLF